MTYETIIFSRYQLFLIESVGVMYFMNGTISLDIHSLFIGALKVSSWCEIFLQFKSTNSLFNLFCLWHNEEVVPLPINCASMYIEHFQCFSIFVFTIAFSFAEKWIVENLIGGFCLLTLYSLSPMLIFNSYTTTPYNFHKSTAVTRSDQKYTSPYSSTG